MLYSSKSFPHPKPRVSIKPLGAYQTYRADLRKLLMGREEVDCMGVSK